LKSSLSALLTYVLRFVIFLQYEEIYFDKVYHEMYTLSLLSTSAPLSFRVYLSPKHSTYRAGAHSSFKTSPVAFFAIQNASSRLIASELCSRISDIPHGGGDREARIGASAAVLSASVGEVILGRFCMDFSVPSVTPVTWTYTNRYTKAGPR